MGFSIETSVPVLTVLIQGFLSFFSPCVLPLVPLYVSYLAGGAKTVDEDGNIHYPRARVLINTIFFVLGISSTFFLLGFGVNALGQFFTDNRLMFARISGIIMILFGFYQFGFFGKSSMLGKEHRLPFRLDRWTMGPLPAFVLGFTFSFAWTPCVGPVLGSVLLMAGASVTQTSAFLLIGVYTIGFILPFVAVGIFTGKVLEFFKRYRNVVQYTVKATALLLILMGVMTLTGFLNNITGYLSGIGNQQTSSSQSESKLNESGEDASSVSQEPENNPASSQEQQANPPAPDFTLTDQYGNQHTLADYKGKTVFLNFWATWCSPCRGEMPEIQALYEKYGGNTEDLIVLGVAGPNLGQEGSKESIVSFLSENEYSFPVVMDETGDLFNEFGIRAFPTTFMIDKEGNIFGYVESALTGEIMESIVQQTMDGKRTS